MTHLALDLGTWGPVIAALVTLLGLVLERFQKTRKLARALDLLVGAQREARDPKTDRIVQEKASQDPVAQQELVKSTKRLDKQAG